MSAIITNPTSGIRHPVDNGVRFDPVDQWTCPPDAFLYRIECNGPRPFVAGLLVRSMIVIEAAPILKWTVGKQWLDVAKTFVQRGWRAQLLKENPRNFTNPNHREG